ncbi:MAG: hypothetical protein DMF69_22460 [Acidobacteria bacterium]|nr:MAG: hypothetical protein DMF69_22460 [Acidobacteriota bacterium]
MLNHLSEVTGSRRVDTPLANGAIIKPQPTLPNGHPERIAETVYYIVPTQSFIQSKLGPLAFLL